MWPLTKEARVARFCKRSSCTSEAAGPASFDLRVHNGRREGEVSVHWLNFFAPLSDRHEQVKAVCSLVRARHTKTELTLNPRQHRVVVLDVGRLLVEGPRLAGPVRVAAVRHTPRFRGDSHSSVLPLPGVGDWPVEDEAYHFAFCKLLADCCEPGVYETSA